MAKGKVSGWYDADSYATEQIDSLDNWYRKIVDNDYRGVSVEAPSKMILALGKIAKKEGVSFQDLIERILSDYLKEKKCNWEN